MLRVFSTSSLTDSYTAQSILFSFLIPGVKFEYTATAPLLFTATEPCVFFALEHPVCSTLSCSASYKKSAKNFTTLFYFIYCRLEKHQLFPTWSQILWDNRLWLVMTNGQKCMKGIKRYIIGSYIFTKNIQNVIFQHTDHLEYLDQVACNFSTWK